MPEPALTIAKERLEHTEIDAEGVSLGKGLAADLVHEEPIVDEWGFITGHKPVVLITKDEKPIARFWKGLLWVDTEHHSLKVLAKTLNQLVVHYYGWPVAFAVQKDGKDPALFFKCRDYPRKVDKHSTPIRYR